MGCRIEQVVRFEDEIPMLIDPSAHFDLKSLHFLIAERPILVPFKNTVSGEGLLPVLRKVIQYLTDTLKQEYYTSEGVARFDASWKAFQCELALEELFYGRPLSPLDFQLSVSLGTNTVSDKSLTNQRGFLGLAPHSNATSEETTPPLHHWTRDELQKMRIERIFPLCQVLDAAPSVTGAALIRVLLGDLYKRNTELPLSSLCGDSPPGRLIGALSLEEFCKDLATKDSFPAPNTFARARILVEKAGKDVNSCLLQGFVEEKFTFFPAMKFRDVRGTKKVWWNGKDFVQVHLGDQQLSPLTKVAAMTLQACMEIERRSLAYSRTLEKYRDHGMPWMEKVLSRLPTGLRGDKW
ncbi:uncharacterized protein LOC120555326 [Scomber scombrus]|uniref:Uncharacterized protein LOC120555326 n=1 Tax=Scomber scombrus TaxID=13677 RepID=A0AAV1QPX2_SCOSC